MKRYIASALLVGSIVMALPTIAQAHVVVKPAQTTVGSFESFTTGVPNEKEVPVTGIRVVIPSGLKYVTPNVKPGWTIETKKDGENITEINWTGGEIPVGQRDGFMFSAQVPAKATTIDWKAYETYQDGSIVSWDQKPSAKEDDESGDKGPYSETKVVNDLASASTSNSDSMATMNNTSSAAKTNLAIILGLIGVVLGAVALLQKRK